MSADCRMDLITVRGNLNGPRYQQEIHERAVVPHFDNHPLGTRPIFMDDNAIPHRVSAVIELMRQDAIDTLPWPARSPDLNPIEHLWDVLGRSVRQREPPVQTLDELTAGLHEEWQRIPQNQIRRMIQGMRRRLEAVVRGGYTRY
ncbi:transposase [Paenibacillus tengchongensis]|uniref:transposase n=1 Tax=Paenibacillus tengchongensis TaxID=2608684 RepID=UPI003CCE1002